MWPFGKKKDADSAADTSADYDDREDRDDREESVGQDHDPADEVGGVDTDFDPVGGDFGPFDGDSVDYRDFDFSDFSKGGLDLGSMLVPVPHAGEVQVEMGPNGPRQIHILTPHGRITPAAFAAPRSGGQWAGDIDGFAESMSADGLTVVRRANDWGEELVGTIGDGVVRVIGIDGPRWMLRMTLAGPAVSAEELAEVAYEVISRTFVNRGSEPAPAGRSLPVVIPEAMAAELQKTIAQQARQAQQTQQGTAGSAAPAQASPATPATPATPGTEGAAPRQAQQPPRRRTGGTVDQRMGETE